MHRYILVGIFSLCTTLVVYAQTPKEDFCPPADGSCPSGETIKNYILANPSDNQLAQYPPQSCAVRHRTKDFDCGETIDSSLELVNPTIVSVSAPSQLNQCTCQYTATFSGVGDFGNSVMQESIDIYYNVP